MVLERPADAWSERDGPCKSIVVDFASVPLTWENGPIRFVKGTANSRDRIPSLAEESLAEEAHAVSLHAALLARVRGGAEVFLPRMKDDVYSLTAVGTPRARSVLLPAVGLGTGRVWPPSLLEEAVRTFLERGGRHLDSTQGAVVW